MQDGNDKGFALYDVNGVVREDLANDNDLNEIFADLENAPVELLEEPKEFEKKRRRRRSLGSGSFGRHARQEQRFSQGLFA